MILGRLSWHKDNGLGFLVFEIIVKLFSAFKEFFQVLWKVLIGYLLFVMLVAFVTQNDCHLKTLLVEQFKIDSH